MMNLSFQREKSLSCCTQSKPFLTILSLACWAVWSCCSLADPGSCLSCRGLHALHSETVRRLARLLTWPVLSG